MNVNACTPVEKQMNPTGADDLYGIRLSLVFSLQLTLDDRTALSGALYPRVAG